MPPEKKRDWTPVVAVAGGGALLALGVWFWLKKPPEAHPGDTLDVSFKFNYRGLGGDYIFRIEAGFQSLIFHTWEGNDSTRREYTETLTAASGEWEVREVKVTYEVPPLGSEDVDLQFTIRYSDGRLIPGMEVRLLNVLKQEVA